MTPRSSNVSGLISKQWQRWKPKATSPGIVVTSNSPDVDQDDAFADAFELRVSHVEELASTSFPFWCPASRDETMRLIDKRLDWRWDAVRNKIKVYPVSSFTFERGQNSFFFSLVYNLRFAEMAQPTRHQSPTSRVSTVRAHCLNRLHDNVRSYNRLLKMLAIWQSWDPTQAFVKYTEVEELIRAVVDEYPAEVRLLEPHGF